MNDEFVKTGAERRGEGGKREEREGMALGWKSRDGKMAKEEEVKHLRHTVNVDRWHQVRFKCLPFRFTCSKSPSLPIRLPLFLLLFC